MAAFRRLSLAVCIVVMSSLVLVASSQAAGTPVMGGRGGGGFPPAGNYDSTTLRASFFLSSDPFQPNLNIFVSGGPSVSKPLGGPTTTTDDVMLSFDISNVQGVSGNGCVFLTNPADFTMGSDLQTAALHTTITDANPTCGGVNGLSLPLTFDVTWTGSGPIENSHAVTQFGCIGYTLETQTSDTSNNADGTVSIQNALTGSFGSSLGSIGIRDQTIHAQGPVPSPNCAGGIGGKGGPGGLTPAGNYHTRHVEANTDVFPTGDPSQPQLGLSASIDQNTSMPSDGVATSTSETDVSIFLSSPQVSAFGCWRINPADFTIAGDLSTAALHTTLTADGPSCQGQSNSLSQPTLQLDVIWVGAGPIATTGGSSQFSCESYRSEASDLEVINNGGATTISVSGLNGPLTGVAGLGSNDTHVHASGVPLKTCTFRG
jgi:hypothetical protein